MLVPLSVRDVMTAAVETVAPDADAREVASRLREANVGSLVVCEGGRPVGIVTEADVVDLLAEGTDVDATTVRAFMSDDLVTVGPEATVEEAARLLEQNDFRRLPVVEERESGPELVGIVTTTDLSYFLPHLSERRRAQAEAVRALDEARTAPVEPSEWTGEDWDEDWEFEGAGETLEVGDVVRFRKRLTDEDVRAFARATGDTNPLHLDEEFAAGTRFGGRIAHGVLTAGVVSAALARLPGQVVYLAQDLSFLAPVDVGETVTAVCEVVERLGDDRYRLTTAVYDGGGDRVLDGEAVVLVDA